MCHVSARHSGSLVKINIFKLVAYKFRPLYIFYTDLSVFFYQRKVCQLF